MTDPRTILITKMAEHEIAVPQGATFDDLVNAVFARLRNLERAAKAMGSPAFLRARSAIAPTGQHDPSKRDPVGL